MRIIITIKDKNNIDSTVDKVLEIGSYVENRYGNVKIGKCKCLEDGTTLIIES